jgi:serine/threonine protein kinase
MFLIAVGIVMEYMNGGSLQTLLDQGRTFDEDDIAAVAYSVLRALHLLHSRMIIHRDIKVCNTFYRYRSISIISFTPIFSREISSVTLTGE